MYIHLKVTIYRSLKESPCLLTHSSYSYIFFLLPTFAIHALPTTKPPLLSRRSTITCLNLCSQALRVVSVELSADEWRDTGCGASESDTTALSVFSNSSGASSSSSSGSGSGTSSSSSASSSASASCAEGAADGTVFDVGVCDGCAGVLGFDGCWNTGCGGTSTTGNTWSGSWAGGWVVTVEPQHVDGVIVPERHNKNHTGSEILTHLLKTSESLEFIGVVGCGLLLLTECIADCAGRGDAGHVTESVVDDFTVLHVDSVDGAESTSGRTVISDELSNNGEWLGCVYNLARAVEALVAKAERIEITTIFVANAVVSVVGIVTASVTCACSLASGRTDMGSESIGNGVGFPDIHLVTAGSRAAGTRVGTVRVCGPASDIGHTVDELNVLWTLRVTVTCALLGSGLVCGVFGNSTVSGHGNEVQSSVYTTR